MLLGGLLNITLSLALLGAGRSASMRPKTSYTFHSATVKPPPSNLFSKLAHKLRNSTSESFFRAKCELFLPALNEKLRGKEYKVLMVLEQSELFKRCNNTNYTSDGSEVNFSDNDKVLLPPSFFELCKEGDYNVPFQLLVRKVHLLKDSIAPTSEAQKLSKTLDGGLESSALPTTKEDYIDPEDTSSECLTCSSIEFRTDENYIYVPKWMMANLKLKPFDLVRVSLVKLPDCTGVELRCLDRDFYEVKDVKRVLEERLKYYSTLTLNSVIPITIQGRTYNFKVVGLETAGDPRALFASIQDIDISVKLS